MAKQLKADCFKKVVPPRLELGTPTLSVLYSNQLSYETVSYFRIWDSLIYDCSAP